MCRFRWVLAVLVGALAGCAATSTSTGWNPEEEEDPSEYEKFSAEVSTAIAEFRAADEGMERFFDQAYAYAVFPKIGKGGFIVGGAYGSGHVFEQGELVGRTTITELNAGLQIGAQAYREIIFFKDQTSFEDFTQGNYEFDAQISAVAANQGVAGNVSYSAGVAVFTLATGGLMVESSLGGQKFTYEPIAAKTSGE